MKTLNFLEGNPTTRQKNNISSMIDKKVWRSRVGKTNYFLTLKGNVYSITLQINNTISSGSKINIDILTYSFTVK